ncbi:MAG: 4-alpha-glucanotransferase [Treponema sp.]|nr:4-alpha-glucanotransferase [Treponema sp.]
MEKQITKKRLLGVVVPVGALRSKNGIGAGEFSDLTEFAQFCKKMNLGLIQILPVNDTGFESSPYASLTANGLHPLYLRIEELDEYGAADASIKTQVSKAKKKFDKDIRFSHYNVLKEKLEICRSIYNANKTAILKSAGDEKSKLSKWIKLNHWVVEYAVYRRLKEANSEKSWKEWKDYQTVTASDMEKLWNDKKLLEEHLFWVWLQQALDTQFSKAAKAVADEGIVLEGDLPILMNEDSCDVWAHPEIFIQELSAGAPPDMYSPDGQNWGFPIYNWEAQEKDNYSWWRRRLETAGKYYHAYRIDHVLGFFRIWACSRRDISAVLGRYVPYKPVTLKELKSLKFDESRIRWITQPHIPTGDIWDALKFNWGGGYSDSEIASAANDVFSKVLTRVNNDEELWLFNNTIKGEKDIIGADIHPAVHKYLLAKWSDRTFHEFEKGKYFPAWYYRNSMSYNSLSHTEKNDLAVLLEKHDKESQKIWEDHGKKLLSILVESSNMLPCAEDLGAVPECVPLVLANLNILGLRVVRWFRSWNKEGHPYIQFEKYPVLSVCTPAVHDSSTVREWWEKETNQEQFSGFIGVPSLPKIYNPGTARIILSKIASSSSVFRVFQVQDLLHLSNKWYSKDPASERINVPGTVNNFNWSYRLPALIEDIAKDKELIQAVIELSEIKPFKKNKSEIKT